jgi:hypothetical protein
MDLLFRLGKNAGGFEVIQKAKDFFNKTLPSRDRSFFYDVVKRDKSLNDGDTIYFAYDSYILAKATYAGEIKTVPDRDTKYIHGHKLKNIQLLDSSERLNNKIFGDRTTYINNVKQEEINRVLNSSVSIYPDDIVDNNQSIIEGAKKSVVVNIYERNPIARQQCLDKHGYVCIICTFDFERKYGEIGKNFIHVHHIKPLSEIDEEYEIDPVKDLCPVCPNCHAMLHRKNPAYMIEEIKNKIVEND